MKVKQKNSAAIKAVLFIFTMGMTFALGWFVMARSGSEPRRGSSEPGSVAIVSNSTDEGLSAMDEEWERIQQWLEENEVQINENRIPENIDHLEIIRTYEGVGNYEVGFGGFAGEYDDLTVSWELASPQERLNIRLSNTTSDYYPVLLKVFYNYETTDFRLVGEENYRDELLIHLPPGYEYIIPFHLDSAIEAHDGYNKLTISAFFDPDEYSVFHGWGHDLDATALTFEMNYGLDEPPVLDKVQHSLEERADFDSQVPLITLGPPGSITPEDLLGPGRPRQASPGEMLEMEMLLNVRGNIWDSDTGESTEVEDFLIIGLLDFNQIALSGRPFLWTTNGDHPLFGSFTLEAPMEPGLYDFIALIVTNPNERITLDNFDPIEMSTRFTIEVIDE